MGATCGCGDEKDVINEVSTDPKKLGEAKFENYRDSKVIGGQTEKLYTPGVNTSMPDPQVNMPLHFSGDEHMALLEAQARKDNL